MHSKGQLEPVAIFTDGAAEGEAGNQDVGVGGVMIGERTHTYEFLRGGSSIIANSWQHGDQKQLIGQDELAPLVIAPRPRYSVRT